MDYSSFSKAYPMDISWGYYYSIKSSINIVENSGEKERKGLTCPLYIVTLTPLARSWSTCMKETNYKD